MDKIIGFIGSGNMGGAIIGGITKAGLVSPEKVIAADMSSSALENLSNRFHICTTTNNLEVAEKADILFLAVKPGIYPIVIEQIKSSVKKDVIIIVIAAGMKIQIIEEQFGRDIKVVRTMPNTPALVGEGMSAICPNKMVSEVEMEEVKSIFNSFGESEIVGEYLMDVVTGVSGSAPAYVYMFIEAMADAAVTEGMPRTQAYRFAAQAVMGSAKMVLETGIHPGELKDNVCSPGGTTIAAVCELENKGMRTAVISAVKTATAKSKEMSK